MKRAISERKANEFFAISCLLKRCYGFSKKEKKSGCHGSVNTEEKSGFVVASVIKVQKREQSS